MAVVLTPEHEAWLVARVARGDFPSLDEAIRQMLDARIVEDTDDLEWAADDVAEARAAMARGETIPLEEHKTRNAARLARSRG